MLYYFLFALLFFSAILEQFVPKRQATGLYYCFVIVLILFAGTRYDFGRDYFVYKEAFYELNLDNYAQYLFEPLFTLLCVLFRPLGFNLFVLFLVSICIIYKSWYIKRYSLYPLFSLLIYYSISVILYEMGQMRQGIAMVLALSSYKDCIEGNRSRFFVKVFIGFLLHYSMIILLPCYWIVQHAFSRRTVILFILLLLPFTYINLSSIFLQISSYIYIDHIAAKILEYSSRLETMGINISLLLRLVVLFILLYYEKEVKEISVTYVKFTRLYFYGVCLYIIFNSSPEIAMRTAAYFKILEFILFPIILYLGKGYINKLLILVFISLYLLWTISRLFLAHPDAFHPYKSYLFSFL